MDQHALEVRVAFERYLETQGLALADLTLGSAFKTMIGFHSDIQFAWADLEWDNIRLEWEEERNAATQSGGFLGLFRSNLPGQVTDHSVVISRSLDGVGAHPEGNFVIISIKLHYAPSAKLEAALSAGYDERLDSSDASSMEAFVTYVLQQNYFIATALEIPGRVELMLEI